jgi:hypothetical protein
VLRIGGLGMMDVETSLKEIAVRGGAGRGVFIILQGLMR